MDSSLHFDPVSSLCDLLSRRTTKNMGYRDGGTGRDEAGGYEIGELERRETGAGKNI